MFDVGGDRAGRRSAGGAARSRDAIILGGVKGTAFDTGQATLDPAMIAAKFWDMYVARAERQIQIA